MSHDSGDLERRFLASIPESDGARCPEPAVFWEAVAGELEAARTRALVDHTATCRACSEALRIARDVRAEGPDGSIAVPTDAAAARVASRRGVRWMGRAATGLVGAALAASVGVVLVRTQVPREPIVERGGPAGDAPADVLRPTSSESQPASDVVLRWTGYPGALGYNVTVLTPDLAVVHRAVGVATPEVRVPATAIRAATGSGLLWNVDAVLPDGRTVGSRTFKLQVQ